jgi:drug/metabolite transporter (DMT)-like permease
MKKFSSFWSVTAPVIFILLWASGFSFLKMGLAHAEPLTFLALRYAVVLGVLLPVFLIMRPPLPRSASEWRHQVVIGLLIQTLYFSLSYLGMKLGVSAGLQALIVSLQPILVALAAPALVRERVSPARWLGLALGLAGAALVIVSRSAVDAASTIGIICSFGALLTMSAGSLYEKRSGVSLHPVTANLVQYAVGFAATFFIARLLEDMRIAWTGELIVALVYLVVGNSLISLTLLLAMIRRGEASRVSALFFLVPPVAALVAWLTLGETMPAQAWLGMVLAAAGVAVVNRS